MLLWFNLNIPIDSPGLRIVNSVDVPFHVVYIVALMITHRACKEPLPLLAVHLTVVNLEIHKSHQFSSKLEWCFCHLEIMFIGTFEGAVSTRMFVLVHLHKRVLEGLTEQTINEAYFVESMIVLSVVVDRLPNEDALLTRVVVFPLVVNFNVLLHHTVLARLERAPGANTSKEIYYFIDGFPRGKLLPQ